MIYSKNNSMTLQTIVFIISMFCWHLAGTSTTLFCIPGNPKELKKDIQI